MNEKFSRLSRPYVVWLFILAVIPAIVMFLLMFVETEGMDFENIRFTFDNFVQLGESSTLIAFRNSLFLAVISTVLCIILGYLVAYKLFRSRIQNKFLVLIIIVLPMWSNLLLRTEALANIMREENFIDSMLSRIGLSWNISSIGTFPSVIIGLVLTYVPFMIMPIYNALEKIEPAVEEAALDLGLTDFQKFWKVILPISSKGIITGSIMTFLPCLSGFAIPKIIGQGKVVMIGNVIEQLFINMNYNIGSVLAIIILLVILVSIVIVSKIDKEGETLL